MTLYASILALRRSDIQALRVTDPYSIHRVVYGLFDDIRTQEDKDNQVHKGLLYLDQGSNAMGRTVFMLSNREPAIGALTKEGSLVGTVRSKEIAPDFLNHDMYQFNIVVNPTRRDSKSRKLLPIRRHDEIVQWFANRSLNGWGFETINCAVQQNEVLQFANKNQQLITLSQAHLSGQIKIIDRVKFKDSFANGLGRGSAFGCGMLRLVPIITPNPFDFN